MFSIDVEQRDTCQSCGHAWKARPGRKGLLEGGKCPQCGHSLMDSIKESARQHIEAEMKKEHGEDVRVVLAEEDE